MPTVSGIRRLTLFAGAGALAISGLFAPRLTANTTETPDSGGEPPAFGRMARRLGLSDQQKEQIRGILKSHAGEIETQIESGRNGHKALREAMDAAPLDEARIRQQALALGQIRADAAVLRARIRSEIWPVLSADQQQKAQQMRSWKSQKERRRMDALERWLRQDG
jgi:Spy/CpxP family protein refolding chaperone